MNKALKTAPRIKSKALSVEVTLSSVTISITGANDEEGVTEGLLILNQFAIELRSLGVNFETRDRKVSGGRTIDCIIIKF